MLTKRAQILFDEETWEKLTHIAQKRSKSVGELVRHAVKNTYQPELKTQDLASEVNKVRSRLKEAGVRSFTLQETKDLINDGRRY